MSDTLSWHLISHERTELAKMEPVGCVIAVLHEDGYLPTDEHKSSKTKVRVKWLHLPNSASAIERNSSILSVLFPIQTHPVRI